MENPYAPGERTYDLFNELQDLIACACSYAADETYGFDDTRYVTTRRAISAALVNAFSEVRTLGFDDAKRTRAVQRAVGIEPKPGNRIEAQSVHFAHLYGSNARFDELDKHIDEIQEQADRVRQRLDAVEQSVGSLYTGCFNPYPAKAPVPEAPSAPDFDPIPGEYYCLRDGSYSSADWWVWNGNEWRVYTARSLYAGRPLKAQGAQHSIGSRPYGDFNAGVAAIKFDFGISQS